jgi:hypothetical protein
MCYMLNISEANQNYYDTQGRQHTVCLTPREVIANLAFSGIKNDPTIK